VPSSLFLIGYFGAFREELRNKEFIYKGRKSQAIAEFISQLVEKYPEATILKVTDTLTEEHYESEHLFIRVTKVAAVHPEKPGVAIVRSSAVGIPTNLFSYSAPMRRDPSIPDDFLDLWVSKRTLVTAVALPSMADKAEVTESTTILLNPVEVAIEAVHTRSRILERGIADMNKLGGKTAPQHITMEISGTVDAAVNGGIKNYFSILSGGYKTINPAIDLDISSSASKASVIDSFRAALQEHLIVLGQSIELHAKKCHISMQPLQDHFEDTFKILSARFFEYLDLSA